MITTVSVPLDALRALVEYAASQKLSADDRNVGSQEDYDSDQEFYEAVAALGVAELVPSPPVLRDDWPHFSLAPTLPPEFVPLPPEQWRRVPANFASGAPTKATWILRIDDDYVSPSLRAATGT